MQCPQAKHSRNVVKSLVGLHPAFSLEALQLLDLGGSHRQPLVQGRTFGEETGLPLPEVDALSVVHLTPGVGQGCRHFAKACLARELEEASQWQWYLDCELNQVMDTISKERAFLET